MKKGRLRYSKASRGTRAMMTGRVVRKREAAATPDRGIGGAAAGYSKGEPVVVVKTLFIISGGEKRERDYFKVLTNSKDTVVRVAFRSKKGEGLKPREMVAEARKCLDSKLFSTIPMEGGDTIYLLQDMDEFEGEIRELTKRGMPKRAVWVVSNPSFEIWLYYHYFDSPTGRLDELAGLGADKRSRRLKQLLGELYPGGIDGMKAFYRMRAAIENSKNNWRETAGLPALYSTGMHVVAGETVGLMGEDNFDKLRASWEERTMDWKRG